MNGADAVNHWDVPVTEFRPRRIEVRVLEKVDGPDPHDTSVEGVFLLRRESVTVFDFYRGRANRAETIRRYA